MEETPLRIPRKLSKPGSCDKVTDGSIQGTKLGQGRDFVILVKNEVPEFPTGSVKSIRGNSCPILDDSARHLRLICGELLAFAPHLPMP